MMPTAGSSTASSPFSAQSASSPESVLPPNGHPRQDGLSGNIDGRMAHHVNGMSNGHSHSISPRSSASPPVKSTKLQMTSTAPSAWSNLETVSRAVSISSSHGGSRTDPPRRALDIDMLPVADVPSADLVRHPEMNRMLLQGDPQHITKQRVETAIRVIIDLLRVIPASPSTPKLPDQLSSLILRDASGQPISSLQRLDTYRVLRLQAGTTTKLSSKKSQQAGPISLDRIVYLQTAVYTTGDVPRRVYACKRCRMRELKRKQNKEANRKKPHSSESDSSAAKNPRPSVKGIQPSADYITGENPDQYEPQRATQIVEEPIWDPHVSDWRNEMVLFNSVPEMVLKDGSCTWLPFRVICYGKCHGEKVGFRVKFTLRLHTGEIVMTATTPPIRITDDHKTDVTKLKPGTTGPPAAVPRPRKGRASAASSRRQSPAPSEAESIQSVSEAGAMKSKQTLQARGKPYDRPGNNDFHRSVSSTSIPSMTSIVPVDKSPFQPMGQLSGATGSLSPTYNPQAFDFSGFDGSVFESNAYPPSASQSAPSSNLASPLSQAVSLSREDVMLGGNLPQSPTADFLNALSYNTLVGLDLPQQQQLPGPMFSPFSGQSMSLQQNNLGNNFDNIFDTSSHTSFTSGQSGFSSNLPSGSLFSDSGLVPDDMQGFLDLTGGEGESQPSIPMAPSPMSTDEQTRQMLLAALGQQARPMNGAQQMPTLPQLPLTGPKISTIIPAEGPMAGGTTVAVIGTDFVPGSVVLFGDRAAKVQVVQPGFIQCQAPPAAVPGIVEVSISGAPRLPGAQVQYYKYNMMDTDLMMLALQVRDQYAGSSNDAAYRLAQHVASRTQNTGNGEFSDPNNSSPGSVFSAPQPQFGANLDELANVDAKQDLQSTIIAFLATLDEKAPGSLRRSGAINYPNASQQTMLHIATVMGYQRLVRRLVVIGAHLDLQDVNGYTALGLASLMGKTACVRVLIEAGASYDRPTAFGEMPLDLAKIGEHASVEALLLSAVWSTVPEALPAESSSPSLGTGSEIDDDNPSSGTSDVEEVSRLLIHRKHNKRPKGKQPASNTMREGKSTSPQRGDTRPSRPSSLSSATPQPTPLLSPATPPEAPPPYVAAHPHSASEFAPWMSHLYPGALKLPGAVWDCIPQPITSLFDKTAQFSSGSTSANPHGWVAFPAPSWETLQKMASPEEVKLFTQAMAAAAFNAVVQSGATTTTVALGSSQRVKSDSDTVGLHKSRNGARRRRRSKEGDKDITGQSGSMATPGSPHQVVTHVKRDRMLYLFWLPVLLFVGFWLAVTAVPIATGFCLIYARQITRAIKQRM